MKVSRKIKVFIVIALILAVTVLSLVFYEKSLKKKTVTEKVISSQVSIFVDFPPLFSSLNKVEQIKKEVEEALEVQDEGEVILLSKEKDEIVSKTMTEYEKGLSYYNQGDYESAVYHFQDAIAFSPNGSCLYLALGDSYSMLGKAYLALDAYWIAHDMTDNPGYKKRAKESIEYLRSIVAKSKAKIDNKN